MCHYNGRKSLHQKLPKSCLFIGKLQLATSKGFVAGDLQWTNANGNVVDCADYKAVCYLKEYFVQLHISHKCHALKHNLLFSLQYMFAVKY